MAIQPSKGDPAISIRSGPVPERADGGPILNAVCNIAAFMMVAGLRLSAYAIAVWLACTELSGRRASDSR